MQAINEILGSELEIGAELTEEQMELLCGGGGKSLVKGLVNKCKLGSESGSQSGSESGSKSGCKAAPPAAGQE